MNFSNPFLLNVRDMIVRYLNEEHSQTFPISFRDLWNMFYKHFKDTFDSHELTETIFAKMCIFLCDKGQISKIGNEDPIINPEKIFYYI